MQEHREERLRARVTFVDMRQFRALMEAVSEVQTSVVLVATASGISLQAMDSGHVCLLTVDLPAARSHLIAAYTAEAAETRVRLPVRNLLRSLNCGDPEDLLTLSIVEDAAGTKTLHIEFQRADAEHGEEGDNEKAGGEKDAQGLAQRLVEVSLRPGTTGARGNSHEDEDEDEDEMQVPPPEEWTSGVRIASATFARAIRDLAGFIVSGQNTTIEIRTGGGCVSLELPSSELGRGRTRLFGLSEDISMGGAHGDESSSLEFSLRVIAAVVRGAPLAEDVRVSVMPDKPLLVEYILPPPSSVRYYVAPVLPEGGELD